MRSSVTPLHVRQPKIFYTGAWVQPEYPSDWKGGLALMQSREIGLTAGHHRRVGSTAAELQLCAILLLGAHHAVLSATVADRRCCPILIFLCPIITAANLQWSAQVECNNHFLDRVRGVYIRVYPPLWHATHVSQRLCAVPQHLDRYSEIYNCRRLSSC